MHTELLALVFTLVANDVGVDPALLSGMCWVESNHKVSAIRPKDGGADSLGLCQVKLKTARFMGYRGSASTLLHDPLVNATYAAKYLKWQLDRYHGDVQKAIGAYNSGTYKVGRNGQPINAYHIRKVMNAYAKERDKRLATSTAYYAGTGASRVH